MHAQAIILEKCVMPVIVYKCTLWLLHTDGTDGEDTNSTITIQLIPQQLQFELEQVSLGWNTYDKDSVVSSNLRYSLYTSSCDLSNISVAVNTTTTSTTLSLEGYDSNTYFNITAFDENGEQNSTINEPFRINSGGNVNNAWYINLYIQWLCISNSCALLIVCSCYSEGLDFCW